MLLLLTLLLGCQCQSTKDRVRVGDDTGSVLVDSGDTGHTGNPTSSQDTAWGTCVDTGDCADGLACSLNLCEDGRCIAEPLDLCPWPAIAPEYADFPAEFDTGIELATNISGVDWDETNRRMWLVRNGGPSAVFRLVEDGAGGWKFDQDGTGVKAKWFGFGDAEGITIVDPMTPDIVYLIVEDIEFVRQYDLSVHGTATLLMEWDLFQYVPASPPLGSEGITFVPDQALVEWGFVDADGLPATSQGGMGGLMFVAHQNGGNVYVFDLDLAGGVTHIGTYETDHWGSSGLEFDASTGRLLIWHGANNTNNLEVARLSSTQAVYPAVNRHIDTEYVWDYPYPGNLEGVAIRGVDTCDSDGRWLFLAMDGGADQSVQLYRDWPCF